MSLAEKRTTTFWNRKKIRVSTPTVKGVSRIEAAYEASDKRRFFVPCPHCGEYQTLVWGNVRWPEGRPEDAVYVCPHCAAEWDEGQRAAMVRLGQWRATAEFKGSAGFHLNELYSPWRSLAEIARDFLEAKPYAERLRTWVNTSLGETWEEANAVLSGSELAERAERYPLRTAPVGVLMLTAGVDTQPDRLECYIWGFGRGESAWLVDREVIHGDPTKPAVWNELLAYLARPIEHEGGVLAIPSVVMVDSGGSNTQDVYAFCRVNPQRSVPDLGMQKFLAIKGQSVAKAPIIGKPTFVDLNVQGRQIRRGVKLWPVGSSEAKSLIYGRLKIAEPGPGYVHFSSDLPHDVYEQLTSERLVTKYVRGFPRMEWFLPSGKRNEALDCAVYAFAAAYQLGMARFRPADWDDLERRLHARMPRPELVPAPVAVPVKKVVRREAATGFGSSDWASRF